MRALVVYESMYGNTHEVATHIAEGLAPTFEVEVVPVGDATAERVAASDLLVVGGPTHAHGMSSEATRKSAVEAAEKEGSQLTLDAAAMGPGLRDWFHDVGVHHVAAAAFDTRVDIPAFLSGRASHGIAHRLRRNGFHAVAEPASFFVNKQNHLLDGQDEQARAWGKELARLAVTRQAAPH